MMKTKAVPKMNFVVVLAGLFIFSSNIDIANFQLL